MLSNNLKLKNVLPKLLLITITILIFFPFVIKFSEEM